MLRIDETSGTLVAPQASGLVQESPPDREELLSLVTASWDAFAGELGLEGVRLLAREPVPYVDLLGLDERANRVVVILVTGDTVEWQLGRALGAAADVASWDRDRLLSVHTELDSVDGHESPALVLVAGGYDPRALATIDWLASRHEVPVSAYSVAMVRFGSERLLSVRREPVRRGDARAARSTGCSRAASSGPNLRKEAEYVDSTPPPGRLADAPLVRRIPAGPARQLSRPRARHRSARGRRPPLTHHQNASGVRRWQRRHGRPAMRRTPARDHGASRRRGEKTPQSSSGRHGTAGPRRIRSTGSPSVAPWVSSASTAGSLASGTATRMPGPSTALSITAPA